MRQRKQELYFDHWVDVDEWADLQVDEDLFLLEFDPSKIEDSIEESLWNTHYEGNTEVEVIPRKSLKTLIAEHMQYQNYVCAEAFQANRIREWEARMSVRDKLIARGIIKPAVTAVVAASTTKQTVDKENRSWQQPKSQ